MNYQTEILNKLKLLSDSLLSRGNKTGEYYFNLYQKSINTPDANQTLLLIADEILSSSGKIQDLAVFDYKEDLILNDVFSIAKKLLG